MGNMISDLVEGASKGLFSGIGAMAVSIRQAIKGVELDPNKAAEIEKQLAEIEQQAKELDVKFAQITEEDRDSARKREVEARKTGSKEYFPMFLDFIAIAAFISCIVFLFYKVIPEGPSRDILLILIGTLAKIVGDTYAYWRGSSSGSSEKTGALTSIVNAIVKK